MFVFPANAALHLGVNCAKVAPKGQTGGPLRVPVCLAQEGDLSPLSAAFLAAGRPRPGDAERGAGHRASAAGAE